MKRRILLIALVILGVLTAGFIVASSNTPQVVSVYPLPGSTNVPVGVPVRITFSKPMQAESVSDRLVIEPAYSGTTSWEENTFVFWADKSWPAGTKIIIQLKPGVKSKQLFSLPLSKHTTWSFKTSKSLLIYLWPSDGGADLYALDPDAGDVLQLTHTKNVLDFHASGDGFLIFYSATNEAGGSDIFRLDRLALPGVDETIQPEMVVNCGEAACRMPQLSPDDLYLAYERTPLPGNEDASGSQVWVLPMDTQTPYAVGDPGHSTSTPDWTARNYLSYYDNQDKAFIVFDPETQTKLSLQNETGEPGTWNPEGTLFLTPEVFFESTQPQQPGSSALLVAYSLSDITQGYQVQIFSQERDLEDTSPAFSPDGQLIAFARKYLDAERWTPGRQLWLVQTDTGESHPVFDEPEYNFYDFAWSPDGSRLAFVRFNISALTIPPELWMVNTDGTNPVQLVIKGFAPQWIP
jgi:Tol biopolymer transport system component